MGDSHPGRQWPTPPSMDGLPRHRARPVPHVAAWSSEGQIVLRHDPLIPNGGAVAVFSRGRQGRGRPVFGAMAPDRQRHAVLLGRCQVCDSDLDGVGWLPLFDDVSTIVQIPRTPYATPTPTVVYTEPLACEWCALWAATGCPGVRASTTGPPRLLRATDVEPIIQLVDPGAEPLGHWERFDRVDGPEDRARISRQAMRRRTDRAGAGVVGYIKWTVTSGDVFTVPDICPWTGQGLAAGVRSEFRRDIDTYNRWARGFDADAMARLTDAALDLETPANPVDTVT